MTFNSLLIQLNLDKSEFNFQFQSHPDYPSALAFSDTLSFLGIANEAYELENEFWGEIDKDFITMFQNKISLVKKIGSEYKVYSDEAQTVDFENLKNLSTDLVILLDREKQKKYSSSNKHWIWLMIVILFSLIIYFLTGQWNSIFFNLLSLGGIYISLEIFKAKFGDTSIVLSNVCGKTGSQTEPSSCERIISSDKTNFLGLKLADISLVYFTTLATVGLFLPAMQGVLFLISLLATSVILYSAYIQIFVEKIMCRICILIILILIIQAGIVVFTFNRILQITDLLYLTLAFTSFFLIIKYINDILDEKQTYKEESANSLRFKRNFELFEILLNKNPKIEFKNKYSSFFFGEKDAPLHISLISNPFCIYCGEAHNIMNELLTKYPEHISIQIRFNYSQDQNPDLDKVISAFKFIYSTEGEFVALNKIHKWFEERNIKELPESNINLRDEISIGEENFSHGFSLTPVILINGRQYPDMYNRKDIFYFIDKLI